MPSHTILESRLSYNERIFYERIPERFLIMTLAMPYQMLASSIPQGKTGIYMGIFNMFIVVPMIIQIFSVQYLVYDLLDQNPINIIRLAGIFLITGGLFSLFVSQPKTN